jgi:hypothetical protein
MGESSSKAVGSDTSLDIPQKNSFSVLATEKLSEGWETWDNVVQSQKNKEENSKKNSTYFRRFRYF